eukprot:scaffold2785_cov291-Pinguiococcus_pyrenoidosus.AAC.2
MEPPLPLVAPPTRPSSSANTPLTLWPRTSAMQWQRYDVIHESSLVNAASVPIATASWPSYRWQKPRMFLALYSVSQVISMRRMMYIWRIRKTALTYLAAVRRERALETDAHRRHEAARRAADFAAQTGHQHLGKRSEGFDVRNAASELLPERARLERAL